MSGLRYTVQVRNGLRWYTVRTFQPSSDGGFALADKVAEIGARQHDKPFRVLLMPFNVLAVEYNSSPLE